MTRMVFKFMLTLLIIFAISQWNKYLFEKKHKRRWGGDTSRLQQVSRLNVYDLVQKQPLDKLKKISKWLNFNLQIMMVNTDGNMNIAMTIRTAAVMGCSKVWIVGKRGYDARPEVGSKHYIEVEKLPNIDPSTFFRENNMVPILVEQGGTSLHEFKFKPYFTKKVCLIVGSESDGIPKEFLEKLKDAPQITVPQYGLVRSLNVSVASAIVVNEYIRQRYSVQV